MKSYFRFWAVCLAAYSLPLFTLHAEKPKPPRKGPAAEAKAEEQAEENTEVEAPEKKVESNEESTVAQDFGAASVIPADTEFYFGLYNVGAHVKAIKNSVFWKKVTEFLGDSLTSAPMEKKQAKALDAMFKKEVFISMGKGSADALKIFTDLSNLYSASQIKAMLSSPNLGEEVDPAILFQSVLSDPRTKEYVEKFEVPSILIGFKAGPDAADVLESLVNPAKLKRESAKNKEIKWDEFTIPSGETFQSITLDVGKLLSRDMRQSLVASLPEDLQEMAKTVLETMSAKSAEVTFGVANEEWILFSLGKDHSHVQFTPAEESLRATPHFARIDQWQDKKLALVVHIAEPFYQAANDPHPFTPTLKGIAEAFVEEKTFRPAAKALLNSIDKLAAAEEALFAITPADGVAVGFIEDGLQVQSYGGNPPQGVHSTEPNHFESMVNEDQVFGIASSNDPEYMEKTFTFVETFASIAEKVANATFNSPAIDKENAQNFNSSLLLFRPLVTTIWSGVKDISRSSGNQSLLMMDLDGKAPKNLPKELRDMKIPRIAAAADVKDRAGLAKGWSSIEATMLQLVLLAGQTPPEDQNLFLTKKTDGVTTHTLNLPDMAASGSQLGSAISDEFYSVGSSQELNKEIITKAPSLKGEFPGLKLRFNMDKARELLTGFASAAPDANIEDVLEWTSVMDFFELRFWRENDEWRGHYHLKVQDIESFD